MTHSLSVPDHVWEWAQRQAGPGHSPGHWLRAFLTEAIFSQQQPKPEPQPTPGPVLSMYLDDYWMPRPLRQPGSYCNKCGVEFPIGASVMACRFRRSDGSTAAHYFHFWHVPQPGPQFSSQEAS